MLDAVAELDLEPFYAAYRLDGWGAAAHDPEMMVALLVYAYAEFARQPHAKPAVAWSERRTCDEVTS